jgi:hypothetical protein
MMGRGLSERQSLFLFEKETKGIVLSSKKEAKKRYRGIPPKTPICPLSELEFSRDSIELKQALLYTRCSFLSFGANKRTKESIHPHHASPYMERMQTQVCRTHKPSRDLVSRDDAMSIYTLRVNIERVDG